MKNRGIEVYIQEDQEEEGKWRGVNRTASL